jgi:hypothetical protein
MEAKGAELRYQRTGHPLRRKPPGIRRIADQTYSHRRTVAGGFHPPMKHSVGDTCGPVDSDTRWQDDKTVSCAGGSFIASSRRQ